MLLLGPRTSCSVAVQMPAGGSTPSAGALIGTSWSMSALTSGCMPGRIRSIYGSEQLMRKVLFAVAVLTVLSAPAMGNVYNWTGDCSSGCSGQASGVLTLTGGSPSAFVSSQFIDR